MAIFSIAMPTRDRAELFEQALESVLRGMSGVAECIEVTVSDGSADNNTGQIVKRMLADWPGESRYRWEPRGLGLVPNINSAMELTTGEWTQQLHDDDYLLPEAGKTILNAIARSRRDERVLLFGVDIVDGEGRRRRTQTFAREEYLAPDLALHRLLSNSSFVRLPALVVHRQAFEEVGLFDEAVGGPADLDICVRLFSRYGVRCVPTTTCAYRIHDASFTSGMWNPNTIRVLVDIFDRAVAHQVVPERNIRRWQVDFFHQFILAGCYRHLRAGRRGAARQVLQLFQLPEVRDLGLSRKWLGVRVAFAAATVKAAMR